MIAVEDAFAEPENIKYLFIAPFQLKAKFYPIAMFLLLMVASIRVDLIVPFFLGVAVHFGKVNKGIKWLSEKMNEKLVTDRLIGLGFVKDGQADRKNRPLDELATNDSIFLDDKWKC